MVIVPVHILQKQVFDDTSKTEEQFLLSVFSHFPTPLENPAGHANFDLYRCSIFTLQYVDFSFEKGLSGQNHSSSGSYYLEKKFPPQQNFPFGDDH